MGALRRIVARPGPSGPGPPTDHHPSPAPGNRPGAGDNFGRPPSVRHVRRSLAFDRTPIVLLSSWAGHLGPMRGLAVLTVAFVFASSALFVGPASAQGSGSLSGMVCVLPYYAMSEGKDAAYPCNSGPPLPGATVTL